MKDKLGPRGNLMNTEGIEAGNADATLDQAVQTKIGEQLRAFYDDVIGQGVPDRFAALLRQLDAPRDENVPE